MGLIYWCDEHWWSLPASFSLYPAQVCHTSQANTPGRSVYAHLCPTWIKKCDDSLFYLNIVIFFFQIHLAPFLSHWYRIFHMATLTLTQQWLETWRFKLVYFIFYMQIVFLMLPTCSGCLQNTKSCISQNLLSSKGLNEAFNHTPWCAIFTLISKNVPWGWLEISW